MASVAASGIFNALAFAEAGFLFKSLDKNRYEDERKRHNLAMEKLTAAKDKWKIKTKLTCSANSCLTRTQILTRQTKR